MSPKERLEAIERQVSRLAGIPLSRLRVCYALNLEKARYEVVVNLFGENCFATMSCDASLPDEEIISYFVKTIRSDYPSLL